MSCPALQGMPATPAFSIDPLMAGEQEPNGDAPSATPLVLDANGAATAYVISVTVTGAGFLQVTASVSTTSVDPVTANNSASLVLVAAPRSVPLMGWLGLLGLLLTTAAFGLARIRQQA